MSAPKTLPIDIRPFAEGELSAIIEMRRAMTLELDGSDLDADGLWRERFAEFVTGLIARHDAAFFVAQHDGELVGTGGVYVLRNHRSEIYGQPSAYVTSVYVAPAHRRLGVAKRITQAAIEWARGKGCVVVRLRASKQGRMVYESLGFTPTEEMELHLDR
ncbi:MAG TPA: GNAT family N-acetyltransferase [Candidatus Eremiobacteraceae bacterium]|nr:GNAT family N-acetyltransferase [Candidatus Eremiobacteraceae bacterium]